MIEVRCIVETYETEPKTTIKIHNHWSEPGKVQLEVNGIEYVVKANELIQAIQNCTKIAKY
jgi:hypothetical protein